MMGCSFETRQAEDILYCPPCQAGILGILALSPRCYVLPLRGLACVAASSGCTGTLGAMLYAEAGAGAGAAW